MKHLNIISGLLRDMAWYIELFRYKVEIIPNNPNTSELKGNIVYVVAGKNFSKWAYLKCPCGCNSVIMLSLNKNQYPSWKISQDSLGRASISPSINKLDGCKSHFFIKKGKLIWASSNP